MPHGVLFQARRAIGPARYLPRWQQSLLAAALLTTGIVLLAFGELAGIAPSRSSPSSSGRESVRAHARSEADRASPKWPGADLIAGC